MVFRLTLQKGAVTLPRSHMAACARQEPWGPRRPVPAGHAVPRRWPLLVILACVRAVRCVLLSHVRQGDAACHTIALLRRRESERSPASVYQLFPKEIMLFSDVG